MVGNNQQLTIHGLDHISSIKFFFFQETSKLLFQALANTSVLSLLYETRLLTPPQNVGPFLILRKDPPIPIFLPSS
jgi:hypothetical protein